MKKIITLIFLLSTIFQLHSQDIKNFNYNEYTLENGLQVFIVEDFSSAPVRIEFTAKAGISAQTPETAGFFPLYARLFKYAAGSPNKYIFSEKNYSAQCGADSSRYVTTVAPSQVRQALENISSCAFNPIFSDKNIQRELSALKTEVMQYANSPAGFINGSIDSRVFSAAPWKQDSGIYPALFTNTTPTKARSILNKISREWYVPQNCAVFISGAIRKEDALFIIEQTFGQHKAGIKKHTQEPVIPGGTQKKFVIHDSQFSEEITQIVVQYISMNMTQADIAALAYNLENSSYKNELLKRKELNIRGSEYINSAAAHKNGCSRIIFQSLLEKSKTNPVEQAKLFEQITKNAAKVTSQDEYNFSKQKLISDFENILKNSKTLMDYISQYWAIEQIITDKADSKTLTESFFGRTTNLYEQNLDEIKQLHQDEQPFVFVLVNSKTYKNYRTAFKKAGYEAVDIKNGSWYTQKLYKNAILGISEEKLLEEKKSTTTQDFFSDFEKNNSQNFDSFTLQNEIPVTVKSNNQTSNAVILVSIKGGKLADKGNSGFTNVMTNAFASNIQNEIYKQKYFGTIKGTPEILAETNLSFSTISVECNYEDLENCIKAISDALIFGEILPADADSYVYSVQTQKRLYNGSPVNQLYSKAINYLYSSADYKNAFDSEKDILEFTNYLDILEAYPKFLNARLYNVVIIGNTNTEQIKTALEKSIGQLSTPNSKTEIKPLKIPEPNFTKSKKLSVKIRHLFYTDVAAEDAGPMPAILVPTKNFEDPVQFWVKSPEATSKEFAYFSALSFYLADQMEELGSNQNITSKIQIVNASKNIPAASFTFLNVAKVSNVNTLYKNTIANLKEKLKNPEANIIHDIKISWLMNTLSSTQTNRGTAILINEGINNFGDSKKYIKDYELIANSTETDFLAILNDYFPEEAQLRLYSADAK